MTEAETWFRDLVTARFLQTGKGVTTRELLPNDRDALHAAIVQVFSSPRHAFDCGVMQRPHPDGESLLMYPTQEHLRSMLMELRDAYVQTHDALGNCRSIAEALQQESAEECYVDSGDALDVIDMYTEVVDVPLTQHLCAFVGMRADHPQHVALIKQITDKENAGG